VRFDAGSLAMYANDASNFREVPSALAAAGLLSRAGWRRR
jgi:hypothetical protein